MLILWMLFISIFGLCCFFIYMWIVVEMPVPIAIIVCEGDLKTIVHIAKALKENIPVIIMKGSGKAADLVLDYIDK